jgi:hypothetical protein
MAFNGKRGKPWAMWEKDLLIQERQKYPATSFKNIATMLNNRTPAAAHRAATDMGMTNPENSKTARSIYQDKSKIIYDTIQVCIMDRKLNIFQTRDHLEYIMDIKMARSTLAKRMANFRYGTPDEQEIYKQAKENGKRTRALRVSLSRKQKFKKGEYDHLKVRGGGTYGQRVMERRSNDHSNTSEATNDGHIRCKD